MFIHLPPKSRRLPLCLVTDYRLPSDAKADDHHIEMGGSALQHVLEFYKPGRDAISGGMYSLVPRVALFEHGDTPGPLERRAKRAELRALMEKLRPRVVAVIPNETGGAVAYGDTVCWRAFNPPDGSAPMRGTFFEWENQLYVTALHAPSPWAKQLQHWQQRRFIDRAMQIARGNEQVLKCKAKIINVCTRMLQAFDKLGPHLAVDIESIESSDTITAIGVSDGKIAISVPWHTFVPLDAEREPSLLHYGQLGADIRAALMRVVAAAHTCYFHNYTFDVPRMQAEGFEFHGAIEDTFAAHAIAFPELRHGLQLACADLLAVRPWKSLWHPKNPGITREDEEYWSCDPLALRDYNADDAFHTYHLAQAVMPSVGGSK